MPLETMETTYRRCLDRVIRMNHSTFIAQLHLLPPLYKEFSQSNDFKPANEARDSLDSFLKVETKGQCGGVGIKCPFKEPHGNRNELTLRFDGESFVLNAEWKHIFRHCYVNVMSVISIWGFYSEEEVVPKFIFRLDGYATENDPLPPLTDMDIVDHETVQYVAPKKGCFNDCRCSIG